MHLKLVSLCPTGSNDIGRQANFLVGSRVEKVDITGLAGVAHRSPEFLVNSVK